MEPEQSAETMNLRRRERERDREREREREREKIEIIKYRFDCRFSLPTVRNRKLTWRFSDLQRERPPVFISEYSIPCIPFQKRSFASDERSILSQ